MLYLISTPRLLDRILGLHVGRSGSAGDRAYPSDHGCLVSPASRVAQHLPKPERKVITHTLTGFAINTIP